jgi:hypothetical protein
MSDDGLIDLPNYVHRSTDYTLSVSNVTRNGIMYTAQVCYPVNKHWSRGYCVFKRIDTIAGESRELTRIYVKNNMENLVKLGADPALINGKYGNVAISLDGADLCMAIEMRVNGFNVTRWHVFKGLAV